MVSIEQDPHSQTSYSANPTRLETLYSSSDMWRHRGRSMRTIRSTLFSSSDNLPSHSILDIHPTTTTTTKSSLNYDHFSLSFSHYSLSSTYISGELLRLSHAGSHPPIPDFIIEVDPCPGHSFSTEIIDSISPQDLQPTVKLCIHSLASTSIPIIRSAAAKLRFLAKNRADYRVLILDSGAVPALVPLLKSTDPFTQEHAVTAILNLSLHHESKKPIAATSGLIKSLIYVLKTGTETSKQNAAAALMSLAMVEETRLTIGACGAIPPLVALLMKGTSRGKKDALTTLYKLCSSPKLNKQRAVTAGVVAPLLGLVGDQSQGMYEKALVVLSSLCGIEEGRAAIVENGGIGALVEAIDSHSCSTKGKEFGVVTLLQLCADSFLNRELLVAQGAIPPLVSLSHTTTSRLKHKAETLLGYLREPGHQAASSSSP